MKITKITVTNKGRVDGASPEAMKLLSELFTLNNPVYLSCMKFGRKPFGIPKQLHFYEKLNKSSILFPRGATGLVYNTLSKIEKTEVYERSSFLPEIQINFLGDLRPYQKNAVDDLLPKRFGVLESGTGSGKTVMSLKIISERKQPTLIVVHTKELLYQWKARIKTFLDIDCGIIGDSHLSIKPITVSTVKSAANHISKISSLFGHLVVDECHRVPANLFRIVVENFSCKYMLGLSATPFRNDGLNEIISWLMGSHRIVLDYQTLIDVGAIMTPNINIRETVFGYGVKFDDYHSVISRLIKNEKRNTQIIKDLESLKETDGISLVVSDRIEHLNILSSMTSINHKVLTGSTEKWERKRIVDSILKSKIRALFSTVALIGEGFDCPGLTNLFIASPIKYEGRLKQIIGRILRPIEGKKPNVFDYFDRHVRALKKQGNERQRIYLEMYNK